MPRIDGINDFLVTSNMTFEANFRMDEFGPSGTSL